MKGESTGKLDSDGIQISVGDTLHSSFGIPPIAIKGLVVESGKDYIVKTPKSNPKQSTLDDFICSLGDVWVECGDKAPENDI
jgi:hypothetical protein